MKLISLLIVLCSISLYSCEIKIEHNLGSALNAFRTLKIAPWSSMREIREKYESMRRRANSIEKDDLDQAYNSVVNDRKEYDYDDEERLSKLYLIFTMCKNFVIFESVAGIGALIFFVMNKFQNILASPLFFIVLSFELVSKLIPYYFESSTTQYAFSLVVGMVFYGLKTLLFGFISKWWYKEKTN